MFQKVEMFSFRSAFILMVLLINVLIIKTAYLDNLDFYWALLFSLPALAFAIYYKRTASKKATKDKEININGAKLYGKDNVILPGRINCKELNVLFGNSYCTQPYLSSIICADAVPADQNSNFIYKEINLSKNNNKDNSFSKPFRENIDDKGESENDVIWQIVPGYPGCRDHNFNFNSELFRSNASCPCVKMIELKLFTHVSRHNTSTKRNRYAEVVINTKYPGIILKPITKHTAFSNAESMVIFLDSLRQLSGKKPVGIRLCVADKKEFHEICHAFRKTEIIPDYIAIEDCSIENNLCMPLYEALLFASKALEIYGLTKEIKIIAVTQIYTALDVLKLVALGADAIIMQNNLLICNNKKMINASPTAFLEDYFQLRNKILRSTIDLMNSFGYINAKEITLSFLLHRLNDLEPMNTDINRDHFKGAQEKPFRIIKNTYSEQNKSAVISFN
jgi:hypothetical protein